MDDFQEEVPYHGDLLMLEQDALSWNWSSGCQKQFDDIVKATGLPVTNEDGSDRDVIVCNCCLHGRHVGAWDQEWIFDEKEEDTEEPSGWDTIPSPPK
jgi:hypothetical protein